MRRYKFATLMIAGVALMLSACTATKQEAPAHTNHVKQAQNNVKPKQKMHILQRETDNRFNKLREKANNGNVHLTKAQANFIKPYKYQSSKIFKMMPRDSYGRALASHIQLSENQAAFNKRSPYLTIRPSGWHNYKFTTSKNGNPYTTWLYNRGHLVGYQFCGLNQAPGNMITQTTYLNQGGITGMNDQNPEGQLYYENKLRSWLIKHPADKLDYSVAALYAPGELVPQAVRLSYVGYTPRGKKIRINMPIGSKAKRAHDKLSYVILSNTSPQATINYKTGRAKVFNSNSNSFNRAEYKNHLWRTKFSKH